MLILPQADKGGYWGGPLFSLGGHSNPLDVDLKNNLFGSVVLQQGSLVGRRPTVCSRKRGPAPVYIDCGPAGWIGAPTGTTKQWNAGPSDYAPVLTISPTLDSFTIEWSTYCSAPNATTYLNIFWQGQNNNYNLEINQLQTGTAGSYADIGDLTNDDHPTNTSQDMTGLHRWCLQRSASKVTLFFDGTVIGQVPRTTSPLIMATGTIGFLYVLTEADTSAPLQFSRLAVSEVARYPDTGYTATAPLTVDIDSLLLFRFTEGQDNSTFDLLTDSQLTIPASAGLPAWYTSPPPGL